MVKILACLAVLISNAPCMGYAAGESPHIEVAYQGLEGRRALSSWSWDRLTQELKWSVAREGADGGTLEGALLSALLEKSFAELSPEERAQTDWVVLLTREGKRTALPRFLLQRYPVMVGRPKDGRSLASVGLQIVLPLEREPKLRQEVLPLAQYEKKGVHQIILTRLEATVSSDIFLKERSDPLALRGEKRFLQNCVGCHQNLEPYKGAMSLLGDFPKKHASLDNWSSQDWAGLDRYRKQLATQSR